MVYRTFSIDYVAPQWPMDEDPMICLFDALVEVFESHGFGVDGATDQPFEDAVKIAPV